MVFIKIWHHACVPDSVLLLKGTLSDCIIALCDRGIPTDQSGFVRNTHWSFEGCRPSEFIDDNECHLFMHKHLDSNYSIVKFHFLVL